MPAPKSSRPKDPCRSEMPSGAGGKGMGRSGDPPTFYLQVLFFVAVCLSSLSVCHGKNDII